LLTLHSIDPVDQKIVLPKERKTDCVVEKPNIMAARVFSGNTPWKAKVFWWVSDKKGD